MEEGINISIEKLCKFVEQYQSKRITRTAIYDEIAKVLYGKLKHRLVYYNRQRNSELFLNEVKLKKLLTTLKQVLNIQYLDMDNLGRSIGICKVSENNKAQKHNANLNYAVSKSDISPNLTEPFFPVHMYVSAVIETYSVKRNLADDTSLITEGRHIRIDVHDKSTGVVCLPVDYKSGEVLLITQYRHSQECFLTEAPRGFGNRVSDASVQVTAKRELREETGVDPLIRTGGDDEILFLKELYTDTGKLTDLVGYYLIYIDRSTLNLEHLKKHDAGGDPVWVRLPSFYKAIYTHTPILLSGTDYQFVFEQAGRFIPDSSIKEGQLEIKDAFTSNVAMLAYPHLARKFQAKFGSDWFNPLA